MHKIKIMLLKRKVRSLYKSYHNICNNYSCGNNLAEYVNSNLSFIKNKFNETIAKLKELDSSCPDFKL